MASLLNNHFVNSAKAVTIPDPVTASCVIQPSLSSNTGFSFKSISISEVQDELTKLDPNKSAGFDRRDPMFLKASAHIIAAPITRIFNLYLQLSVFPDWKLAMIFPRFKGGSDSNANCHWPISILPCLTKVLETLVHKQPNHFLASTHILSDLQSGLRPGHGCMTATMLVLDDIITAFDSQQVCIAAFIDLAKDFDSVEHRILLHRLSKH